MLRRIFGHLSNSRKPYRNSRRLITAQATNDRRRRPQNASKPFLKDLLSLLLPRECHLHSTCIQFAAHLPPARHSQLISHPSRRRSFPLQTLIDSRRCVAAVDKFQRSSPARVVCAASRSATSSSPCSASSSQQCLKHLSWTCAPPVSPAVASTLTVGFQVPTPIHPSIYLPNPTTLLRASARARVLRSRLRNCDVLCEVRSRLTLSILVHPPFPPPPLSPLPRRSPTQPPRNRRGRIPNDEHPARAERSRPS